MESQTFWQGIEQFNQRQFYACHDTLEALWMEASQPAQTFYQGILQIAVGCYHLGNHNWRGAVILLGEGIAKLRNYEPDYHEIDVTSLIDMSWKLLEKLQQIPPEEIHKLAEKLTEKNDNVEIEYPQIFTIDSGP
jgi:predicted metal-dependent hydrolase